VEPDNALETRSKAGSADRGDPWGDPSTINAGGYSAETGFAKVSGASLRAVFDLADLNRSQFQLAPGQSGNVLTKHSRDLVKAWSEGKGFEIRSDWSVSNPPPGAHVLRLESN
jgi:penicillin amidase